MKPPYDSGFLAPTDDEMHRKTVDVLDQILQKQWTAIEAQLQTLIDEGIDPNRISLLYEQGTPYKTTVMVDNVATATFSLDFQDMGER